MAELKIYLSNSLNDKFRRIAMSVYGYGRGSLSKAAEEALAKWCSEREPSTVPEKTARHGESALGDAKEEESHIDPDERENMAEVGVHLAGSPSPNSIRPSA